MKVHPPSPGGGQRQVLGYRQPPSYDEGVTAEEDAPKLPPKGEPDRLSFRNAAGPASRARCAWPSATLDPGPLLRRPGKKIGTRHMGIDELENGGSMATIPELRVLGSRGACGPTGSTSGATGPGPPPPSCTHAR